MPDEFSLSEGLTVISPTADVRERVCRMIDESALFSDLEWPQIEMLVRYMDICSAQSGAVIFSEGDPGNFACLLLEGKVDVYKQDHNQQRKNVISLGPGKFFGEMSLIDEEPRSGTAVAGSDAMLAILTKEKFERLTNEKPGLGIRVLSKLAKLLSQRLRRASGILVEYLHE